MNAGFKISFCTVCMNRLHHLRQTLPENIKDNLDYGQLEFVLLDYNSQDGLEQWINSEFTDALASGRLKYFKTREPGSFNMAHSRNMVTHVATGDIVCLIDADNYTGPGFATFVNDAFSRNRQIFLTAISRTVVKNPSDVLGRICVMKTDFAKVTGFDEFMTSYGFEDYDLVNRLQLSGLRRKIIEQNYLRAISHPREERTRHMMLKKKFHRLFIHQVEPCRSEVLFLFSDYTFSLGTLVNDHTRIKMSLKHLITDRKTKYEDRITAEDWTKGTWTEQHGTLILTMDTPADPIAFTIADDLKYLRRKAVEFFAVPPHSYLIDDLILFHSVISNRNRMSANLKRKIVSPNERGFGLGTVYKNFDYENPIQTGVTQVSL